ncbi:hypothetical protein CRYUN_Cryun05aG0257900 [Craigia yunnanensis]
MIQGAVKLSRLVMALTRTSRMGSTSRTSSQPLRFLHAGINCLSANPVTVQMINYALSRVRSQKSDESYAQGMLILEQYLSTQSSESEGQFTQNSIGTVLLAMSTLLYERGSFEEAIEKLHRVQGLTQSSLGVRVAVTEALVGLYLQLDQDDTSSVLADKYFELLDKDDLKSNGGSKESVIARAKAMKGLVELVSGNLESAISFFQGLQDNEDRNVRIFQNFGAAEEILTKALTKTEEYLGSNHPKVGVVLTCIALMSRNKARQEHSSSLLIQED